MTDAPLQNKVAVVTGAGGGIGRDISRVLSTAGARIVAVDKLYHCFGCGVGGDVFFDGGRRGPSSDRGSAEGRS